MLSKRSARICSIFTLVLFFLLACSRMPTQTHNVAQPSADNLQAIIDDHWRDFLARNPVFASSIGIRTYDDQLGSLSIESMDAEAEAASGFLTRLEALNPESLSEDERLNKELLTLSINNTVEAAKHHGRLMIITNRSGWHMSFARLPERARFFTEADYKSYISRLQDFPRLNKEGIETLKQSIAQGYTQACAAMESYEISIKTHIVKDASESVFMKPFSNMPSSMTDSEKSDFKNAAKIAIETKVIPSYQQYLDFYTKEYGPACRNASGLYGLPGSKEYYAYRAKAYTTTDLTPEEIHSLGLAEVARIINEMNTIIEQVKFKGSRKDFIAFLREDPQFYPKTREEHLRHAAFISKKADGALPKLFSVFPRMPYTVKAVPDDIAEKTTTAYYEPPAGDGSRAGVYRVNLSKLDTRPNFEMEALTLHEAVPGHHFQIAIAQELAELPAFRRYGGVTAFVEGWGLYSERLGLEMGFYEDPYANFGRLSYEMWRACRLVVDTGLHAKGWSRQQAIDFMTDNTALSIHNIESEVDRYITWPGQALAYKIGELKIRELRAKAENALGNRFDVRHFHDTVLQQGPVPLKVLEQVIDRWITAESIE